MSALFPSTSPLQFPPIRATSQLKSRLFGYSRNSNNTAQGAHSMRKLVHPEEAEEEEEVVEEEEERLYSLSGGAPPLAIEITQACANEFQKLARPARITIKLGF